MLLNKQSPNLAVIAATRSLPLLAAFDIDLEQIQGESVIDQAGPIKTDEKPGLFYNRSHSGGDLVKIFLNTHAYRLTHDEPLPGDVDFIADSLQTIFDWAEIWGDIAIGSQVKATHSMTLMIKEAEERGLRVFGLRTFDKVNSFHICNIHIAYKTNAAAVVLSPND